MPNPGFHWQPAATGKPQRPLMDRIDDFTRSHPGIRITAPYNAHGKWEASEPGKPAAAYGTGTTMMEDLETRYPR